MNAPADYSRPDRLEEVLAAAAAGARVAAGCTDVFPATTRQVLDSAIVDITGIPDLRGIRRENGGWRIGAATTWTDIQQYELPSAFDGLKLAAREVGSVQIQNSGTIGGNLCNASPAADGVPPLLTLDAEVELASLAGIRRMPLATFLRGVRQTALQRGEVLTAVLIPDVGGRAGFLKLGARKYLVISIAMVAVRLEMADGLITGAALSIGSCSAVAVRLPMAEAALIGTSVEHAVEVLTHAVISPELSPISDIRGKAEYRSAAAVELLRRVVRSIITSNGEGGL